jgi:hypothetical protein
MVNYNKSQLHEILSTMNEILEVMLNQDTPRENLINSFIDGFLFIKEHIEKVQPNKLEIICKELGDILFAIVTYYNEDNVQKAINLLENELESKYSIWVETVKILIRYKVVLCGINSRSSSFLMSLNKELFEVVAFLNYPEIDIEDEKLDDIPILSIENLHKYSFDNIVILTDPHEKVQQKLSNQFGEDKIINFHGSAKVYMSNYDSLYHKKNYWFSLLYSNLEKAMKDQSVETIVTGSSHALHGIDVNLMRTETVKLCIRSQDLYYDYLLAKKAIGSNSNIKQCIIGLSYFSIGYDLSLSTKSTHLVDQVYYPVLKDSHHYSLSKTYIKPKGIENINEYYIAPSPFDDEDLMTEYLSSYNYNKNPEFNETWNKPCEDFPIEWLGRKRARLHNKSIYPKTISENKKILESYINLLLQKGIKPIIVVFPTTEYYYSYISKSIKSIMYQTLEELKLKFNFTFYDYAASPLFDLHDFADCDHLNKKGAAKMTLILSDLLESSERFM